METYFLLCPYCIARWCNWSDSLINWVVCSWQKLGPVRLFLTTWRTQHTKRFTDFKEILIFIYTALFTTSFHPPPFSGAPKFYIRYAHPISLRCHQLYIAIVANACGCTQGPFWLPWRIILVGQGNCPGSRNEATQNLPDVRFLNIRFLSLFFAHAPPKTLSLQLPMKFSNIVWVETSRYLIKITILRKADREGSYSQAYGFATITMYSQWQPSQIGCAYRM